MKTKYYYYRRISKDWREISKYVYEWYLSGDWHIPVKVCRVDKEVI